MDRKRLCVNTQVKALPNLNAYRGIIKKVLKWFAVVHVSEKSLNLSLLWVGVRGVRPLKTREETWDAVSMTLWKNLQKSTHTECYGK